MRARSDNDTLANAILSGDAAPEPLAAWTLESSFDSPTSIACARRWLFPMKRPPDADSAPRVLVAGTDAALFGLIEEWLAGIGCAAAMAPAGNDVEPGEAELVIVDIPSPRSGGPELLRRIAADHPGIPLLALSSSFFAGIDVKGAVARQLGVAAVLAKPVAKDVLTAAVSSLLAGRRVRAGR